MRQNYTYTFSWIILLALAIFMNFAFSSGIMAQKIDTTITRTAKTKLMPSKSNYPKNGLHLALPPLKPAATSSLKVSVAHSDDKLLNDVEVFPNPVTDQINVRCVLSRNAIISVKVLDILGNEVITVVSQRIGSAGEQNFSYILNNKLSRGLYFIRIVAGTETVIKRISVL